MINFKDLAIVHIITNKASLINPQGALKTLQVRKYKSCIDLLFCEASQSLRERWPSLTQATYTFGASSPKGTETCKNIFQSAVMVILGCFGITVYINVVFISNNNEEDHLEQLQREVERITEPCLKFDRMKSQLE